MTNRTMYDGINTDARQIREVWKPGNLVGFYTSGTFAWSRTDREMFPPDALVGITPDLADLSADVADCETGDLTPMEAAKWVGLKRAQGYGRPSVYRSLSGLMDLIRLLGYPGINWDAWVADWDGTTVIPFPHAAAKQFRNLASYDVSVVYDPAWPHRSVLKPPASAPSVSVTAYPGYADFGLSKVDGADNYQLSIFVPPATAPFWDEQSHDNHFEHVTLMPGHYVCKARARNRDGYGPWSAVKAFEVP